jgi:hypothetical protein
MRFKFTWRPTGKGLNGWNEKHYWHITKFSYPGCKSFQIRLYDRIEQRVMFQKTWR